MQWAYARCDNSRVRGIPRIARPMAVSTQCQFLCKTSVAPSKRQCSATVALWKSPFSRSKNVVPGSRKAVLDDEVMLNTQEVTGSSPVSPIAVTRCGAKSYGFCTPARSPRKRQKLSRNCQLREIRPNRSACCVRRRSTKPTGPHLPAGASATSVVGATSSAGRWIVQISSLPARPSSDDEPTSSE